MTRKLRSSIGSKIALSLQFLQGILNVLQAYKTKLLSLRNGALVAYRVVEGLLYRKQEHLEKPRRRKPSAQFSIIRNFP